VAATSRSKGKAKKDKTPGGQLVELVVIVAVALGLALGIQAVLVKPYRIPSPSMVPTLVEGQRILVNRLSTRLGADPKDGDIVVFHPPTGADGPGDGCAQPRPTGTACDESLPGELKTNFVKRVAGVGGDRVGMRNGRLIRNGKPVDEPYARLTDCEGNPDCSFEPILVPKDHFFMIGDNRGSSQDSRYWGPVPREAVIGGAFATYWPPKRIGIL
jgi:signal peptidase I